MNKIILIILFSQLFCIVFSQSKKTVNFYDRKIKVENLAIQAVDTIVESSSVKLKIRVEISGRISAFFTNKKYISSIGFLEIVEDIGTEKNGQSIYIHILLNRGRSIVETYAVKYSQGLFCRRYVLELDFNYIKSDSVNMNEYVRCNNFIKELK